MKPLKLAIAGFLAVVVLGAVAYFLFIRHPASSIEFFGVRYGQSCSAFADTAFDGHRRYFDIESKVRGSQLWAEGGYKTKSALAEACEKGNQGDERGFIKFASPNGTLMKLKVISDDDNMIVGWDFYIPVSSSISVATNASSSSAVIAGTKIEGSTDEVMTKVNTEASALRQGVVANLGEPLVQLPCGSATTTVWRFRKLLLMSHGCEGGILELYSARRVLEKSLHSSEMRDTLRKALQHDGLDL